MILLCGQLYANKMGNLEELYSFLEINNLPRLNEEKMENMNISITSKKLNL